MKLLLTNLLGCQVLRVSSIFCVLALRPHHDPETDIPDSVLKPQESAELAEKEATETDKTNATNATNATNLTQTTQHPDTSMPSLLVAWLMSRQSWSDPLQFTVDIIRNVGPKHVLIGGKIHS